MRPRAVLLDLFHTLVHVRVGGRFGPPTWETLGLSREDYEQAFYDDQNGRSRGEVRDPVECMRLVAHAVDDTIPLDQVRRAHETRARRFTHAFRNLPAGVAQGIERLRAADVRLGLVSNVMPGEAEAWAECPIAHHFETAVFSCDVGIAKPDAGIYRLALDQMGLAPDHTWFAGDGGSDELRGARDIGLTSVLVTHVLEDIAPHRIAERSPHADHVVPGIDDLADLVLSRKPT